MLIDSNKLIEFLENKGRIFDNVSKHLRKEEPCLGEYIYKESDKQVMTIIALIQSIKKEFELDGNSNKQRGIQW